MQETNLKEITNLASFAKIVENLNFQVYGKCPKISYPKVSDKMVYANSADPHQTAQSDQESTLLAIH